MEPSPALIILNLLISAGFGYLALSLAHDGQWVWPVFLQFMGASCFAVATKYTRQLAERSKAAQEAEHGES